MLQSLARRVGLSAAVLLLAAALLPPMASAEAVTVTIDGGVSPASITVSPGSTVTWVNHDGERRRIRTTSGPDDFDTGDIEPGASAAVSLGIAGTYRYEDHRDGGPAYLGTITVSTGGGPGPGPGPTPGPAPGPTTESVSILDDAFSPASVSLSAGSTVNWMNVSDRDHTVTADAGAFGSGTLGPGAGFTAGFDTPGTFAYFCVIHPDMRGTIAVGAAGQPPPPLPAPPAPLPAPPPPPAPAAGGTGGAGGAGPASHAIQIIDFEFRPASISARVGDTVSWQNDGQAPHTATADSGAFDSGNLNTGAGFSTTLQTQGTFGYFCTIHPNMRGTIAVGAADAPPPPVPAAPTGSPQPPDAPEASSAAAGGEEIPDPVTHDVQMIDFEFRPQSIEVLTGDSISWKNDGQAPHTATADDGSFDTGVLESGDDALTTFDDVGEFSYLCTIHPNMTGSVTVVQRPTASGDAGPAGDDAAGGGGDAGERDISGGPGGDAGLLPAVAFVGAWGLALVALRRFMRPNGSG